MSGFSLEGISLQSSLSGANRFSRLEVSSEARES